MKTIFYNKKRHYIGLARNISLLVLAVVILFFSACISSTKITGSWKNPEAVAKTYGNIFIASLTSNVIAKSTAESAMANALVKENISVTKSISVFQPVLGSKDSISLQQIEDKVRSNGYDAILTITLLKKTTESRYVPGYYYPYAPMVRYNYYGRFGGYYNYWYPSMYDPGYYTLDDIYFMEVNLYDAHSDALVWSAQTRTYNPSDITPVSKEFAETIVGKMKKEGLLKGNAAVVKQ